MSKMARNEQRKLGATLLNAIAVSILASVAVTLLGGLLSLSLWVAYPIAVGLVVALHLVARGVLGELED